MNRTQYPGDVIALVVLWRLRYKLALRDLPEMFLIRGIVLSTPRRPSMCAVNQPDRLQMVRLRT